MPWCRHMESIFPQIFGGENNTTLKGWVYLEKSSLPRKQNEMIQILKLLFENWLKKKNTLKEMEVCLFSMRMDFPRISPPRRCSTVSMGFFCIFPPQGWWWWLARWIWKVAKNQILIKSPSGWWLNQPIWKICSSNSTISPSRVENKKYLKPSPSEPL